MSKVKEDGVFDGTLYKLLDVSPVDHRFVYGGVPPKTLTVISALSPISHKFKTLKSTFTSIVSKKIMESKILHPELLFDICKKYFPAKREERLVD